MKQLKKGQLLFLSRDYILPCRRVLEFGEEVRFVRSSRLKATAVWVLCEAKDDESYVKERLVPLDHILVVPKPYRPRMFWEPGSWFDSEWIPQDLRDFYS